MARAHFVKAARKDYPEHGIKKGESYYWWAFMQGGRGGPKHYSKTAPKPSQLTQSNYLSQLYAIQEDISALEASDTDELKSNVEDIVERLRDLASECEDNRSNMPDSLQDSDSGTLLEERAQACNDAADELEQIDFDDFDAEDFDVEDAEAEALEDDSNETDEDRTAAVEEARSKHDARQEELRKEWLEEKLTEVQGVSISD